LTIAKDKVVSIQYTLKDDSGNVLDSSEGEEPLIYIHGIGGLIPGLESELEGKGVGEKLQVTIAPENAYGPRRDEMVQSVPKTEFENHNELAVGNQFQVETDQGPMVLTVMEVKDDEVVLDGNHPLAGMTLHFDVEIIAIRDASEEELSHGHVHGPGGHQH
jgi:FKBP-type peptidyl-prolyl cis-trans isomerase SlyD